MEWNGKFIIKVGILWAVVNPKTDRPNRINPNRSAKNRTKKNPKPKQRN